MTYGPRPLARSRIDKRMFYERVGARLAAVREAGGVSQTELAKKAGTTQSTVTNAEHGMSCSLFLLVRFADALGVDVNELLPADAA